MVFQKDIRIELYLMLLNHWNYYWKKVLFAFSPASREYHNEIIQRVIKTEVTVKIFKKKKKKEGLNDSLQTDSNGNAKHCEWLQRIIYNERTATQKLTSFAFSVIQCNHTLNLRKTHLLAISPSRCCSRSLWTDLKKEPQVHAPNTQLRL